MSTVTTPASGAAKARALEATDVVDPAIWYEQHIALLHQFLHRGLKVVSNSTDKRNNRLIQQFGQTHTDLQAHALKMAGKAVPTVLSSDGKYPIPYLRLAEARAKAAVLRSELEEMRAELTAARALLNEVRLQFTRDDGLQDNLLPRINAALASMEGDGA